jgi:hypothetical protein
MKHTIACLLLLGLGACQAQAPVAAPLPVPATEQQLVDRIRAEIGDAPCSSDAQCRTLPIGHKSCGGPAAWWAWSTANARAEPLQAWARQLADLQQRDQARSGLVSNCQLVADPGARCVAQRCTLAQGVPMNR